MPPFHCLLRTPNSHWPHALDKRWKGQRHLTTIQQYAYISISRLTLEKKERSQARHLEKAMKLLVAAESSCLSFTLDEPDTAIHVMRRKEAANPDIPPTFKRHSAQWVRCNYYIASMTAVVPGIAT